MTILIIKWGLIGAALVVMVLRRDDKKGLFWMALGSLAATLVCDAIGAISWPTTGVFFLDFLFLRFLDSRTSKRQKDAPVEQRPILVLSRLDIDGGAEGAPEAQPKAFEDNMQPQPLLYDDL